VFNLVWPISLVIISNVFYQICAKSVPNNMNAFASLTITYLVGAVICLILYYTIGKGTNILSEISKTNFAPIVLGITIVGLEVGFIFAYKAGWQISTASIVQGSALAIILIVVGFVLYKEQITWNKLLGILICLVGIFFINYQKA